MSFLVSDITTTFLYALCDPSTREIRYIGKSNYPARRLKQHLIQSIKMYSHIGCWLRNILAAGNSPSMHILKEVPTDQWESAERNYIRGYRLMGCDLVNATDGGEGVTMTTEIRAKISSNRKGKGLGFSPSLEFRANLSARTLGVPMVEAVKAKLRISNKGQGLGRKLSQEICAKLKGPRGPRSKEAIAKTAKSNSGKFRSPESKRRMSEAQLKRLAAGAKPSRSGTKTTATARSNMSKARFAFLANKTTQKGDLICS